MPGYDEMTVEELRDELRDRDLKVSGVKDELVARLEEDALVRDQAHGGNDAPGGGDQSPRRLRDVVARIRRDFTTITGLESERVTGLRPNDEGWRAQVDVVEVSRVPTSTDVLATYEVTADGDGNVGSLERVRRFRRSEVTDL